MKSAQHSLNPHEALAVFGYPLTSVLSRNGNFTTGHVAALAGMGDDSNQRISYTEAAPGATALDSIALADKAKSISAFILCK